MLDTVNVYNKVEDFNIFQRSYIKITSICKQKQSQSTDKSLFSSPILEVDNKKGAYSNKQVRESTPNLKINTCSSKRLLPVNPSLFNLFVSFLLLLFTIFYALLVNLQSCLFFHSTSSMSTYEQIIAYFTGRHYQGLDFSTPVAILSYQCT